MAAAAPSGLVLLGIVATGAGVVLHAEGASAGATCPACGGVSARVHARYTRHPLDLPWRGATVRLVVTVRRFRCEREACPRRTFAEDLGGALPRRARRTAEVTTYLAALAHAAGGEAGARLAREAGIPVSPDTLLRIQRAAPLPAEVAQAPRVLGVDDLALRRGRRYATILVDLEAGRPIEVLEGREAAPLRRWLAEHPGVEVVVRDRAGAYAEAAQAGAPQAVQVADRFHLVRNASAALDETLRSCRRSRDLVAEEAPVPEAAPAPERPPSASARLAAERRAARLARWEEVRRRRDEGQGISRIAREMGIERRTVRGHLATPEPPRNRRRGDRGMPQPRPQGLDSPTLRPFVAYLQDRWQAGCTNICQLHRELVARGYTGSRTLVSNALQAWRPPRRAGRRQYRRLGAREVAGLCQRRPADLEPDERELLQRILDGDPTLARAYGLRHGFRDAVMGGDVAALGAWLADALASGLPAFVALANGVLADRAAVEAAVTTRWSTGPVEGHVHKVKLRMRQGYGRAGFSLLRARVLAA